MNGVALGPFVFSDDRFLAIVSFAAFALAAEVLARRAGAGPRGEAIRAWVWTALVGWVVAARLGFVLGNIAVFRQEPLAALAIWQGGFDPRAGALGLAGVLAAAWLRAPAVAVPLLAALAVGGMAFAGARMALPEGIEGRLPTRAFADLAGGEAPLAAPEGAPLVVNLWASWCPPCRREMPMLTEVATGREDVAILFANQGEDGETIRRYLASEGLAEAGMLRDPGGALMREFGLVGLPSTLFFSADGVLREVHTGEISRAQLLARIDDVKGASE